ncbi:MAG: hypothetical protein QG614_129 [Patescibacteria group bacterium]|nr:hypothetical protein [Patescibacteria group bacterium]
MNDILFWANIIGYLGLILIYVQVVLGSRHIFKVFTKDTVLVNRIHKQIGIFGILFVLAHPLLEMMNRSESLTWLISPNLNIETETHITFGRFALTLFVLIWVTSAVIREKIKWRPWKYLHLLSYPILFFTIIHLLEIGTFFGEYAWLRIVLFVLVAIFVLSVAMRLLAWAGITKLKYKIIEKDIVGDIMLLKVSPINQSGIASSKSGQHFFLQSNNYKMEHPFSVIRNETNDEGVNTLSFGIRKVGKFWEEMGMKKIGDIINIDGPYGRFTEEAKNNEDKVVIAAGVGITPFIELIEKYGPSISLINCNRNINEVLERDSLKSKVNRYIDVLNEYEGAPSDDIKIGLISKDIIIDTIGENYKSRKYFICGSPAFVLFLKQELYSIDISKQNVYYEDFGF